jgi:glycosyltransferase involved in cell wall biosynthesis
VRIINIVDSVGQVNYGIWHAATANAGLLMRQHIKTELWYPETAFVGLPDVAKVPLASISIKKLEEIVVERNLDPKHDIIITHGSWQYPTRWGAWLKQKGFTWVYVPHGMLDPWALRQKRIKKWLYLYLIERRLAKKADLIKAVSFPESISLQALFSPSKINFIPNGVTVQEEALEVQNEEKIRRYLFLSRLHAKKNVVALAAAWIESTLNNDKTCELLIAGPDQGELEKVSPLLEKSTNMKYIGSVYGEQKLELLRKCSFYILPSFSEGLPTALLEAMGYGLIPIITENCNLPEVFTHDLGIKITTDEGNIKKELEQTTLWNTQKISNTGGRAKQFVAKNYSLEAITKIQVSTYTKLQLNQ